MKSKYKIFRIMSIEQLREKKVASVFPSRNTMGGLANPFGICSRYVRPSLTLILG